MTKGDFLIFYERIIKKIAERFVKDYSGFQFTNTSNSIYEEYMSQKTMLRWIYGKKEGEKERTLLDRHKVCACMTVAIIKSRPLTLNVSDKEECDINSLSRINEQLAFMSSWELLKGFVMFNNNGKNINYELPKTYHNASFLDTITRSLFFANQLNGLSTPLIANIFFLLERYCEDTSSISK